MKKYFHDLTDKEYLDLIKNKVRYDDVERDYPQPEWCKMNHAIKNCWSLNNHTIQSKKDCKDCPDRRE